MAQGWNEAELVTRYPTPQPERTNSPTLDLVASGQQSCPGATNGEAVQRKANGLRCGKVQTATPSKVQPSPLKWTTFSPPPTSATKTPPQDKWFISLDPFESHVIGCSR